MIAVYMDDILMAGESENIKIFIQQFRKTHKITDLEKIKSHLRVWYKWIKNGKDSMVKINMDNMARKIVKEYEESNNRTVKEQNLPGNPSIKLEQKVMMKYMEYISMVGKVMNLVNKSNPTYLNVV